MLKKIIKYVGFAVILIAAAVSIAFFVGKNQASGLEQQLEEASNLDSVQKIEAVADIASNWNAVILNVSVVMFLLSAGFIIFFALAKFILTLVGEPKAALKSILSIGIIVIVIIVSYVLASDAIPNFLGVEKFGVTAKMSKWVDTGLWVTYIFFGLAFFGTLYTEVSKIWK